MRLVVGIPEPHVTAAVLEPAAEAVTRLDEQLIEQGEVPTFHAALDKGLVQWRPEAPGEERFDHARTVLQRGHGDCDDLAPWRAASARATGEDPGARAVLVRKSPTLWHCVVKMSDGRIEDPSKEAGMDRYKAQRGANAPAMSMMQPAAVVGGVKRPSVAVRPVSRGGSIVGWQARVDVPMTSTENALVQLHYAPVASQAIVGACLAVSELAAAAGTICDPETVGPLDAIAGLLAGYEPEWLSRIHGTANVERAMQWLDTAEQTCGGLHNVRGLFDFVGDAVTAVGHAVSDAVDAVESAGGAVGDVISSVASSATHILEPLEAIADEALSATQGIISLIPVIGTGINAAISAGIEVLKGGSALDVAIHAAYGAIPIPPGIRAVTDIVLNSVLALLDKGNFEDGVIAAARVNVPEGLPRDVFDTLIHLVMGQKTGKPTRALATPRDNAEPFPLNIIHEAQAAVRDAAGNQGTLVVRPPTPPLPIARHNPIIVPLTRPKVAIATKPGIVVPLTRAPIPITSSAPRVSFPLAPPSTRARPLFMANLPPEATYVSPAGITSA